VDTQDITASDLRAELARLGLPRYVAAARVGVHPSRLSAVLWERETLPRKLAQRLWAMIQEERARREVT